MSFVGCVLLVLEFWRDEHFSARLVQSKLWVQTCSKHARKRDIVVWVWHHKDAAVSVLAHMWLPWCVGEEEGGLSAPIRVNGAG